MTSTYQALGSTLVPSTISPQMHASPPTTSFFCSRVPEGWINRYVREIRESTQTCKSGVNKKHHKCKQHTHTQTDTHAYTQTSDAGCYTCTSRSFSACSLVTVHSNEESHYSVHTCAHIRKYTHTHSHNTHPHMHARTHARTHTHTHARTHTHTGSPSKSHGSQA